MPDYDYECPIGFNIMYIYIYTLFIYSFIYLFMPNIYIYICVCDLIFWLVCLFHTAFRSARAKPNPLNFLSQNSMVSESRCFSSLKGFGPFGDDLNPMKLVMTCEWSSIGFTTLPNSRNNNDRKKTRFHERYWNMNGILMNYLCISSGNQTWLARNPLWMEVYSWENDL